jgi:hypothetical protein
VRLSKRSRPDGGAQHEVATGGRRPWPLVCQYFFPLLSEHSAEIDQLGQELTAMTAAPA